MENAVRTYMKDNLVAISDDYINPIIDNIIADVVSDIKETSGYTEDGHFNTDDIKLAVGRVLIDRLGIVC